MVKARHYSTKYGKNINRGIDIICGKNTNRGIDIIYGQNTNRGIDIICKTTSAAFSLYVSLDNEWLWQGGTTKQQDRLLDETLQMK